MSLSPPVLSRSPQKETEPQKPGGLFAATIKTGGAVCDFYGEKLVHIDLF